MTEETIVTQDEGKPEPAPVVEPAESTPAPTVVEAAPETPEPESPKRQPWWQVRIDAQTKKYHDEKRAREAAEQRNQFLEQLIGGNDGETSPAAPKPEKTYTESEARALVAEEAVKVAAAQSFNARCNSVYEAGTKTYPDFSTAVETLNLAGATTPDFLQAAVETDAPERVLHHLGTNPDEAVRIAQLPPLKMAIEMERLATKLAKPTPISNAPAPIKAIEGSRTTKAFDPSDTSIPMEQWAREMDKREASRR